MVPCTLRIWNCWRNKRRQDDGRGKMLLTAWLSDYESGNLVLAMDEDGIWYSYYEDLVAGQDE